MANTELSKGNGGPVQRPTDVFGAMRDEMDRLFERFERGWPRWPAMGRTFESEAMVPSLDAHDDGKQLTIEADLPGVDEKDVTVTLANGLLTIKGEKKSEREEKDKSYYLAERSYGSFERSLRLPDTIDESKLEARFEKGVLKVTAPKKPEAIKAEKKIEIKKG
jgi:HSP20 family protein